MKHLLNTLYVLNEEAYLSLENENVVVQINDGVKKQFPLHLFEQILYFGYKGASPALIGECSKRNVALCFYNTNGRFLARVNGKQYGNVLLRKEQYRISDDECKSCLLARNFIVGKIYNSRSVLERAKRDHPLSVDVAALAEASNELLRLARLAKSVDNLDRLRGIEGEAASLYFSCLNELILQNKDFFRFSTRSKRPPMDAVNSLLSFAYTILANDCAAALEGVGLDPYVGFLHRDRPGRVSLALDLMEEQRSCFADRFVLTLINNKVVGKKSFTVQENGVVLLNDEARKDFFGAWQDRKRTIITHPYLQEKIPWGLVPFAQAKLLSRVIRGDLEQYPCFLWK